MTQPQIDRHIEESEKKEGGREKKYGGDSMNASFVKILRDRKDIESLLFSSISKSKSEILFVVSSISNLRYLCEIGLVEKIKQAFFQGSKIIILYPEDDKKEEIEGQARANIKNDVLSSISSIRSFAQLKAISGLSGDILIVDNLTLFTLNLTEHSSNFNNNINNYYDLNDEYEHHHNQQHDIVGVYTDNQSIINNFGSLIDTLLNEKESLRSIFAVKSQLENSNKQLLDANQKLKLNSKIQQDFINMAAHELRTPTTAIIGYIELLEADEKNGDNKRYITSVIRNANRLQKLVEDLLDTTRIEANIFHLDKEKINLTQLIYTVIEDFRIELDRNNKKEMYRNKQQQQQGQHGQKLDIKIFLNSDEKNKNTANFDVMIDRVKIVQVISNLIHNSLKAIYNNRNNNDSDSSNSIKSCSSKDSISITISRLVNEVKDNNQESDIFNDNNTHNALKSNQNKKKQNKKNKSEILVTIKDTGKGIDPKIQSKLFEKFATNSSTGTGLGLYITKSIIEAHGGKIWAENNRNKNQGGATFSFTLPAYR